MPPPSVYITSDAVIRLKQSVDCFRQIITISDYVSNFLWHIFYDFLFCRRFVLWISEILNRVSCKRLKFIVFWSWTVSKGVHVLILQLKQSYLEYIKETSTHFSLHTYKYSLLRYYAPSFHYCNVNISFPLRTHLVIEFAMIQEHVLRRRQVMDIR